MKITNVVWTQDMGGWPFLTMEVDGVPAEIGYEQRFLDEGIAYLGHTWESLVPPIDFQIQDTPYQIMTLRGFTKDANVVAEVERFRRECDEGRFRPGVKVPLSVRGD